MQDDADDDEEEDIEAEEYVEVGYFKCGWFPSLCFCVIPMICMHGHFQTKLAVIGRVMPGCLKACMTGAQGKLCFLRSAASFTPPIH
jgi:hypothetical protein